MPGKDEKERDDSRDWSSDDASAALSMAAKTHLGLSEESHSVTAPSNHWEGREGVKRISLKSANTLQRQAVAVNKHHVTELGVNKEQYLLFQIKETMHAARACTYNGLSLQLES